VGDGSKNKKQNDIAVWEIRKKVSKHQTFPSGRKSFKKASYKFN
jgi:hypothetical protein